MNIYLDLFNNNNQILISNALTFIRSGDVINFEIAPLPWLLTSHLEPSEPNCIKTCLILILYHGGGPNVSFNI